MNSDREWATSESIPFRFSEEPAASPPASAGTPKPVEILVGRWQNAAQRHECSGCVEAIEPDEVYLRLVNLAPLNLPSATDAPADMLWRLVARSRLPVEKYHEGCWDYERRGRRRSLASVAS